MKKTILTLLMAAAVISQVPVQGFGGGGSGGGVFAGRGGRGGFPATEPLTPDENDVLPHFNLAFPGGSPADLVKAIEQATGRPLNAIIPDGYEDVHVPALKMKSVTVPDLFNALTQATRKTIAVATGTGRGASGERTFNYAYQTTSFGFQTDGKPREGSVWYFFVDEPRQPLLGAAPECRFFQLAPYLDIYKVEDITTAVEKGWDMLAADPHLPAQTRPTLSFHKDTKLLIAVGDPQKLELIDSVLNQLRAGMEFQKKSEPKPPVKSGAPEKP